METVDRTLKPCPFCGGIAKLNAPGYEYYSPCWCKCTQCGAEGPTKLDKLEAEEGWNERVQDDVEHAQTIGGWISVKDRLPEKNGRYLCRYEQEVYGEVCRCTDFGMFDSDIGEKGGWFVGKVTHWMPLPEPPKDGDGDA